MKENFEEFFPLTKRELDDHWNNGHFTFDSSVLLNIFRFEELKDNFFDIVGGFDGRIFTPHQVSLEFHSNKKKVLKDQRELPSDLKKSISDILEKPAKLLGEKWVKDKVQKKTIETFLKKLGESYKTLFKELDKLEKKAIDPNRLDKLTTKIIETFGKNTGRPFDQNELSKIYEEGEIRYSKKIPPGFKDVDKDRSDSPSYFYRTTEIKRKFGDYIIWRQLINHANSSEVSKFIFVTSDVKGDWFFPKEAGRFVGPRTELYSEFRHETNGKSLLIYNLESFISHASKRIDQPLSIAEKEELAQIRHYNKKYPTYARNYLPSDVEEAVFKWFAQSTECTILSGIDYGFDFFVSTEFESNCPTLVKYISSNESIYRTQDFLRSATMSLPHSKGGFIKPIGKRQLVLVFDNLEQTKQFSDPSLYRGLGIPVDRVLTGFVYPNKMGSLEFNHFLTLDLSHR